MEQVEKCLSLGAPPASPIDVCVGPRDREAGRRDDGGDGGDGEGGEDCDDFNKDCTGGGDVWRGEDSMKKDYATNGDDH